MLNKVTLVGNVGQSPEIKDLNGNKIAKFSLATSEKYTNKGGEKINNTEWHNIVIFGKLAGVVEKYVKKGDKLYIEGKIKTNSYEKDGIKRYSTSIICNNMIMLGSNEKNATKVEKTANDTPDDLNNVDNMPF